MRHRAARPVDSPTQAVKFDREDPTNHRATTDAVRSQQQHREEMAYNRWCEIHDLDPDNTESAIAYEGAVGWLYLDEPPEDHR